jgi:methylene-fatty-acyl-phospholipid synthase
VSVSSFRAKSVSSRLITLQNKMFFWILLLSAALLSIERISYFLIWRYPETFRSLCSRSEIAAFAEPIDVLEKLFYLFKTIQLSVFIGWCIVFADGALPLPSGGLLATMAGGILILIGQLLNLSVFYRLGKHGVFYGNKLGYDIPWCHGFPFTISRHPQYLGTLISIWGFFLIMRFPNDDWIVLPAIQTLYYALGAHIES